MFTNTGPLGTHVNGNQIEFPDTAQITPSGYGYIKWCANLNPVRTSGAGYLVGKPIHIVHLTGQIIKKRACVAIGSSIQLDLFYQLVCHVIHFLLYGNDMEHIYDEGNHDYYNEYVDKAADIRGVPPFGQQHPPDFFLQFITSWTNKKRR